MSKHFEALFLELLVLGLVGLVYVVVRWVVLRRPITYKEFERWFFVIAALAILVVTAIFMKG